MSLEDQYPGYCPLIFQGIYVERTREEYHKVSTCCVGDYSPTTNQPIDFINNSFLKQFRQETLSGKLASGCHHCWKTEQYGGVSRRKDLIRDYTVRGIEFGLSTDLMHIDYNTLPICNAKCVICSSRFSSLWIQDEKDLGRSVDSIQGVAFNPNTKYNQLAGLDLSKLSSIYFNGGEPLLTDDHYNVLKLIPNISQVDVSYNTNASCWPSDEIIDLWLKAKSITFMLSIDGIEDSFEYIRYPLKWSEVSKNIKKFYSVPQFNIGIGYSYGSHNIFNIKPTIQWLIDNVPNFDPSTRFKISRVVGRFNAATAPEYLKEQWLKELSDLDSSTHSWIDTVRTHIQDTTPYSSFDQETWYEWFDKLDTIRGTNWRKALPRLAKTFRG